MDVTVIAPTKTISIVLTQVEWDVLGWARNKHGLGVIQDVFKAWLRHNWSGKETERLEALKNKVPVDFS